MMIIPPPSLPFGGQITYINPAKSDRTRSSASSKRGSSARNSSEQNQTTTVAT